VGFADYNAQEDMLALLWPLWHPYIWSTPRGVSIRPTEVRLWRMTSRSG